MREWVGKTNLMQLCCLIADWDTTPPRVLIPTRCGWANCRPMQMAQGDSGAAGPRATHHIARGQYQAERATRPNNRGPYPPVGDPRVSSGPKSFCRRLKTHISNFAMGWDALLSAHRQRMAGALVRDYSRVQETAFDFSPKECGAQS